MRRARIQTAALTALLLGVAPVTAEAQDAGPRPAPAYLDLVVTDAAGRPVTGLGPDDLELRDNGVAQAIDAVTFVTRQDEAGAPGRIMGLLLDEFHVDPAHTARVREALARFVAQELRPSDRVVLVKPLDSLAGIRPSGDPDELARRLEAFEGRLGDYEPRTPFEKATISRAPEAAAAERSRVVLSALSALTGRLGALGEGRKTLVFVSEGLIDGPPRGRLRGPGLQAILEAASLADVAIYTIDPAAGIPDEEDAGRAMLRRLADETGGVHATADRMGEALTLAARDLDGYYRIAYRPEHALDGRHPLEVQVQRPGALVRARAAHWAIPALAPRTTADRPILEALSTMLPRRPQQVSPLIATWFGTARGADGRTRVTFTWEPRTRVQTTPAWLTLTATGRDGDVIFEGRVDPIRAVGVGGVPTLSAVFEAPPGLVQIDMLIHDANDRAVDVDRRDIPLPDLRRAGTILSTPAIIRTHNNLQFRTLSADPFAPPVVSRRFSRSERLLVRVYAYADVSAGATAPEVTARLVGRGQTALRELAPLPDAPADNLVQFDVPLAGLAPGEYGIEIRAGERRELLLFDIGN